MLVNTKTCIKEMEDVKMLLLSSSVAMLTIGGKMYLHRIPAASMFMASAEFDVICLTAIMASAEIDATVTLQFKYCWNV